MLNWLRERFGVEAPPRETRQDSSYTDALIAALTANAAGKTTAFVGATAALEACAGLIGRAFAACQIDGPPLLVQGLTPDLLNLIGRSLIRKGELVAQIDVMNGRMRYYPAASHNVMGGVDPDSWFYRAHFAGPQRQRTTRRVMAAGMLHFRYAFDNIRPWLGVGPLISASLAGRLSAETVAALTDEASGPRGSLLPIPVDGDDDTVEELKVDISRLRGKMALIEGGSWNAASETAPDYRPRRVGADPPDSLIRQSEQATGEIYAACGVNPAIFRDSDGTAGREAWRQLLFGTIAPLGGIVEAELRDKLDAPELTLSWTELRASDISGRARAFQSLVNGGMDVTQAATLSGVLSTE